MWHPKPPQPGAKSGDTKASARFYFYYDFEKQRSKKRLVTETEKEWCCGDRFQYFLNTKDSERERERERERQTDRQTGDVMMERCSKAFPKTSRR